MKGLVLSKYRLEFCHCCLLNFFHCVYIHAFLIFPIFEFHWNLKKKSIWNLIVAFCLVVSFIREMTFPRLTGKFPVKHCSHQVNGVIEYALLKIFLTASQDHLPDDGFMQSIIYLDWKRIKLVICFIASQKKKIHFSHCHFLTNFMQKNKLKFKNSGFKFWASWNIAKF